MVQICYISKIPVVTGNKKGIFHMIELKLIFHTYKLIGLIPSVQAFINVLILSLKILSAINILVQI